MNALRIAEFHMHVDLFKAAKRLLSAVFPENPLGGDAMIEKVW